MLTINAQYTEAERVGLAGSRSAELFFFVCDEDGELLFQADACLTLDAMEETDSFVGATAIQGSRGLQACESFCGHRPYWISPHVWEAAERYRSYVLDSLFRS